MRSLYFQLASLFCILTIFTTSCAHKSLVTTLPEAVHRESDPSILVVADPQIHNVYGYKLKQMAKGPDFIFKVAVRPPEVNLLARYSLTSLLEQGGKENESPSAPVIVLGDATNVACSGEFDEFAASMTQAIGTDKVWLMAHGNHDTYLLGTLNSYVPYEEAEEAHVRYWQPTAMTQSSLPTDESWWGAPQAPGENDAPNWKGACYRSESTGGSAPMNKVRWLRKYLDVLALHGLEFQDGTTKEPIVDLDLSARPGSRLHAMGFRLQGKYVRPHFEDNAADSDLMQSYLSFIVQTADLSPRHKLILIDTSVCKSANGGLSMITSNAGSNACLGAEQLELIEKIIGEAQAEKHLVVGGHFPLAKLKPDERESLLEILSSHKGSWTYISAHTHITGGLEAFDWETGQEINVGSTTDWPAIAHRVYLPQDSNQHVAKKAFYASKDLLLEYRIAQGSSSTELCRHLAAGEALATLVPADIKGFWQSPYIGCDKRVEHWWQDSASRLQAYRATIDRRFKEEPAYRIAVLRIFAAASWFNEESYFVNQILKD